MAPNKILLNKANALLSLIKLCQINNISITITSDYVSCDLPCGVEEVASLVNTPQTMK